MKESKALTLATGWLVAPTAANGWFVVELTSWKTNSYHELTNDTTISMGYLH
jgi:hypothetical protein